MKFCGKTWWKEDNQKSDKKMGVGLYNIYIDFKETGCQNWG
jgi:hypothetical protein